MELVDEINEKSKVRLETFCFIKNIKTYIYLKYTLYYTLYYTYMLSKKSISEKVFFFK